MQEISLRTGEVIKLYNPRELKAHLDKFVIGQEECKRTICTAIYNHYKRVFFSQYVNNIISNADFTAKIDKSNILIAGNTGTGKTYIVKSIAEYMGVPYYIADCENITSHGYVGNDAESVLTGLLQKCNYNINLAEYGIIFLDEIDKLAKVSVGTSITKDPGGEGAQNALLKIVEGTVVGIPPQQGRINPEQKLINVDTNNILFVGMGAFSRIENIISKRVKPDSKIGFNSELNTSSKAESDAIDENVYQYLSPDDLQEYGMIPEFIGRFPIITNTNPLSEKDLVRIMKEPENSIISQYKALFTFDDIVLTFDDDALEYIASIAVQLETGARSLRALFECVLTDFMFEFPESGRKRLKITKKIVENKLAIRYKNLSGYKNNKK